MSAALPIYRQKTGCIQKNESRNERIALLKVAAAIIIKDGLILAARKKAGLHLAGYWEFPGGKIEPGETPEGCLCRELREEFGVRCEIGPFLGESTYDYGNTVISLLGYYATHKEGLFCLTDHDEIRWLFPSELADLRWAPADIPLVGILQANLIDR